MVCGCPVDYPPHPPSLSSPRFVALHFLYMLRTVFSSQSLFKLDYLQQQHNVLLPCVFFPEVLEGNESSAYDEIASSSLVGLIQGNTQFR